MLAGKQSAFQYSDIKDSYVSQVSGQPVITSVFLYRRLLWQSDKWVGGQHFHILIHASVMVVRSAGRQSVFQDTNIEECYGSQVSRQGVSPSVFSHRRGLWQSGQLVEIHHFSGLIQKRVMVARPAGMHSAFLYSHKGKGYGNCSLSLQEGSQVSAGKCRILQPFIATVSFYSCWKMQGTAASHSKRVVRYLQVNAGYCSPLLYSVFLQLQENAGNCSL